jgi:hypothetical protein
MQLGDLLNRIAISRADTCITKIHCAAARSLKRIKKPRAPPMPSAMRGYPTLALMVVDPHATLSRRKWPCAMPQFGRRI